MDPFDFDDILDLEQNAYQVGLNAGTNHGKTLGYNEGFTLGVKTGFSYGLLLGKYLAWATIWLAYYEKLEPSDRILSNLKKLISLINTTPLENEFGSDIDKHFKLIQTKYKTLTANINSDIFPEKPVDISY
ncbi:hypothetical protein BB560_002449 [Smittium megazygosporum]|uniref:Essential protein Yae1 N-terminal domain-containing protein n=1 Tax=Smittium megazygosporum TaxID=133381 RepID=A0A2T9ZEQ9_9FUNG|nr:hypothetical protein BB560_002449 [Smittium megazygosporum]